MCNNRYIFVISLLFLGCMSGCTWRKEKQEESSMASKIQSTDSGLQFIILESASDPQAQSPNKGQNTVVHYTGWLYDENAPEHKGKQFDSSVERGRPFIFPLGIGRVIKGWDEGVGMMKVGEKRRFIIPSQLGYGAQGFGADIPPHATLIFDVELLDIIT